MSNSLSSYSPDGRQRGIVMGFVSAGVLAQACAPAVALVPTGPHPTRGGALPIAVDSPPPAAEVQQVPDAPKDTCLWSDGQWIWRDNEWSWRSGEWLQPSRQCYYADPLFVWVPSVNGTGVLFYTHGQWYDQQTRLPCAPPPPC